MVLLAQLAFVARAGGDWAPGFRFGVPLLPVFFTLMVDVCAFLAGCARRFRRPAGWLLAGTVLWVCIPAQLAISTEFQRVRYVNAANKLTQGGFLSTLAEPGITLSSFDIGGLGYRAGGFNILDTAGLTTRETTGCPRFAPERCARYATLALPELIRLHNNRRRDAFVVKAVRKQQPYLDLDGGKYMLQRALVLMPKPPDWAVQRRPVRAGRVWLVSHDLPPALRAGTRTQIIIYWKREASAPEGFEQRRVEWVGAGGHFSAKASDVLWKHAAMDLWRPDEVFADLITVEAPHVLGRFELHVVTGGKRVTLEPLDVVDDASASVRAKRLAALAEQSIANGLELEGIRLLGRAAQLSGLSARAAYHRAVIAGATRLRANAERLEQSDAVGALRIAQNAKTLLHRAYWESGSATHALRREIDANAAMRKRIIDSELFKL